MSMLINTLTQEQFDKGVANWLSVLASKDWQLLERLFVAPGSKRKMANVTFPVEQMALLVSTPGGRQIEARFLALKDEGDEVEAFAIALYATDINRKRVSAYYLSSPGNPVPAPPTAKATRAKENETAGTQGDAGTSDSTYDGMQAVQVPYFIVAEWTKAWDDASLSTSMFINNYGPLQGYTFSFGDFIKPMFQHQQEEGWYLGIDLGLHHYYAPEGPATTFGLALRLYGPNGASEHSFYDMSMPCPPGYYI